MKKHVNLFILSIFTFFTGCVGGGIVYSKKTTYENFSIWASSSKEFKYIDTSTELKNPNKSDFIKVWGEPNKIKYEKETTIWIYKTDTSWAGIVPMIGIGIPLIIPTGTNCIELHFYNDEDHPFLGVAYHTSWAGFAYGPKVERLQDW